MKNNHKINPFWTYSRKERIGIAILTAGIIFNAILKWKNTTLLKSQLLQNVYVEYSVIMPDSLPDFKKQSQTVFETYTTKPKPKQKSKPFVRAVNLWSSGPADLIALGLSDSITKEVYDNRWEYTKWRSICAEDSICNQFMENKKIYFWVDQDKIKIKINSADSTEWKQLRGIGTKLSKRIIAYRSKLGGFTTKEQLKEIWGLQPETYQEIKSKLYLENPLVKLKISENQERFINHPYLPYNIKKKVANYLAQPDVAVDSLSIVGLPFIQDSTINKLSNYFSFE